MYVEIIEEGKILSLYRNRFKRLAIRTSGKFLDNKAQGNWGGGGCIGK